MTSLGGATEPPDPEDEAEGVAPALAPAEPAGWCIGARFGDYELVDILGRGGMAVVYLARQVSLDRLVALKTIAAPLLADSSTQERFRREVRAVAQLDHRGIVSVHDTGVLGGVLFYTMDYVNGPDLGRLLRERPVPAREAASIMQRVSEAVGYAHSRGIVHRDLKPSNVLLNAAGEPRVADFGLALEFEGAGTDLTLTGDLLGTPLYMAPEILAGGSRRAAPPTDVYALGAMLFQSLTGRPPFLGDSPAAIADLALNEQPPSVRLLNPAVPRDLETICLKCLEKAPSARYGDAGTLGEDLQRFLQGEPIRAKPVSGPVRLWRRCRRRPALAMFVAASLLGALGASWAAVVIDASLQRALKAEGNASEGLWQANLAHAQAARRTPLASARREALSAIADAARFRPSVALRNEAIAALCLEAVEVRRSWPLELEWTAAVVFDPTLESYLVETPPGRLVRRSCMDDHELGTLEVPRTKVAGVPVFSPDGRYLAARYADDVVRVWEVAAARVRFALPGRSSPMSANTVKYGYDLAFRPDGTQLAIGAAGGGFTLHAVPGGEAQGGWAAELRPSILRFSPDGSRLAVVGRQQSQVQLLDARTLTVQHVVPLPGVPICAAWTPAGDRLALGTRAARIHFVGAASGQIVDTISAYESGGVGQLMFHPQRPILMGNGSDEVLRFWDADSGRLRMELAGAVNQPGLAFNPDGTRLCAYNNYTRRATLAEISPSPIHACVAPAAPIRSAISSGALDISRDGRWLVASAHGSTRLCAADSGLVLQTLSAADPGEMMTAQFTPDSRALLVSGPHGLRRIEIVVGSDGTPAWGAGQELDPEEGFTLEGVADDGRALLVSEKQERAKVFDPNHLAATVRWSVAKVTSAAFSPDGRQVLTEAGESVPGEAAVKVWDLSTGTPQGVAAFGDDPGGRVQCSRTGGWVLVTGDRQTALRRFGSWQPGPALPAELQGETHHARLSPDGATVAIEKNGKLHLLATATGELLATCETPVSPSGICVNEVFSPDGGRITLLWQYGSLHVWNLAAMHHELAGLGLDWTEKR